MAELAYRSGYAGLGLTTGSGQGVLAEELAGLAAATIMARKGKADDVAAKLSAIIGAPVIDGSKRAANARSTILGTGPGTWLAIAEDEPGFLATLTSGLAGLAAVVDQSDAQAVLRLSGPKLMETLEKGARLDLTRFTPADAAVTSIAHVGATIWKVDDAPTFAIAIPRSYAGSFRHWLEASAGRFGLRITPD